MSRVCHALAALLVAANPLPALAQQVPRKPPPPRGSAYVRFVNAMDEPAYVTPDFTAAFTLGTAPNDRVGAYTVVKDVAGRVVDVPVASGGRNSDVPLGLQPGSFTTVIWLPGPDGPEARIVTDETRFDPLRTGLSFYNAAIPCPTASLTLDPDGPTVFQNVALGEGRMRAVNPVSVSVLAGCGNLRAAPLPLEGLAPGGRESIWLMATPRNLISFITQDTTASSGR